MDLLIPADKARPVRVLDVACEGPSRDDMRITGVHGVGRGWGAASWIRTRPFDWWRVTDLIDYMDPEPFIDGPLEPLEEIEVDGECVPVSRRPFPALGVTTYELVAEPISVLVLPGTSVPSRLTRWSVPMVHFAEAT